MYDYVAIAEDRGEALGFCGPATEGLPSLAASVQARGGDARRRAHSHRVVRRHAALPFRRQRRSVLLAHILAFRRILGARVRAASEQVRVLSATAMAAGGLFLAVFCVGPEGLGIMKFNPVPLSVPLMGSVLAYVQLVAVRLYPRVFYEMSLREVGRRTRTVIVGTGEPGVALAGHIWRTAASETQVVGFVSRSLVEVGRQIEGSPVLGVVENLEDLIAQHGIDQVIIAMPQAGRDEMDWIWRTSIRASAEVKVMPDLGEFLAEGAIKLRELQIEDLLGREPVDIDLEA